MTVLAFSKPERLCIVNRHGQVVQLNDRNRTVLRFPATERAKARRIVGRLNQELTIMAEWPGPFRLIGETG